MTEAYGDDVKVAPMMAVLNYRRDVARILKSAYMILEWGVYVVGCLFESEFGSLFGGLASTMRKIFVFGFECF